MFEHIHLNTVANSAIIYIFVLAGIRLLGKKELGQLSVSDLIFIMLISEAVGDVMRATNDTLLGGLLAALTLMILNKVFKTLVYKSPRFNRIMEGEPSILVRNGEVNRKEMRRNKVSLGDLEQAGREHGVGKVSDIRLAILEKDGQISILKEPDFSSSVKIQE